MLNRRKMLVGLAGLIAAPAIVRAENLMPIRGIVSPWKEADFAEWYPRFIRAVSVGMEPGSVNFLRFEGADTADGPFRPVPDAIKPLGNGVFSMPDVQLTLRGA